MNNAPLTLILIASLGIAAVVSLGVFFALRPKSIIENNFAYAADEVYADNAIVGPDARESSKKLAESRRVNLQTGSAKTHGQPVANPEPGSSGITSELDALRAAPVPKNTVGLEADSKSDTNINEKFRLIRTAIEKDMHKYGKVVGLAYSQNKLYVPSYQFGNISVFSTPDMSLKAEYACPNKCHIYDMTVTSSGEMIIAQGKNEKLTKLDKNGKFAKEIRVPYLAKGISVSQYDEIFVLPKLHDTVYVYDAQLNELGVIPLPLNDLPKTADCNFLDYVDDTLYVSCEPALYAIDIQVEFHFSTVLLESLALI